MNGVWVILLSISSSDWRSSGSNIICRFVGLDLGLFSHAHDSVSSVECRSDLLVCLHESFQFDVQVFILVLEDMTVLVNGITLALQIVISIQ